MNDAVWNKFTISYNSQQWLKTVLMRLVGSKRTVPTWCSGFTSWHYPVGSSLSWMSWMVMSAFARLARGILSFDKYSYKLPLCRHPSIRILNALMRIGVVGFYIYGWFQTVGDLYSGLVCADCEQVLCGTTSDLSFSWYSPSSHWDSVCSVSCHWGCELGLGGVNRFCSLRYGLRSLLLLLKVL